MQAHRIMFQKEEQLCNQGEDLRSVSQSTIHHPALRDDQVSGHAVHQETLILSTSITAPEKFFIDKSWNFTNNAPSLSS
jgi:hypothetical protein